MTTLFDSYVIVDWSANNGPKTGADSIWWCEIGQDGHIEHLHNERTRRQAFGAIVAALLQDMANKRRVLIGFDFPYGYPSGWAKALGLSGTPWLAIWNELSNRITDDESNRNNRFQVAAELNRRASKAPFPFWACPNGVQCEFLSPTKWSRFAIDVPEFRKTETEISGPQSCWKLFTAGSVGGQALIGIPYVNRLLHDPALRPFSKVWPFETSCLAPKREAGTPSIIHAEIYPSLTKIVPNIGEVKDEAQVRALAAHFRGLDACGKLDELFAAPGQLDEEAQKCVTDEEGWILGVQPTEAYINALSKPGTCPR
jgi:hypothetical protein